MQGRLPPAFLECYHDLPNHRRVTHLEERLSPSLQLIDGFFPKRPAATPTIYAFASKHPDHAGLLKVGYTERIAADRIAGEATSLESLEDKDQP